MTELMSSANICYLFDENLHDSVSSRICMIVEFLFTNRLKNKIIFVVYEFV